MVNKPACQYISLYNNITALHISLLNQCYLLVCPDNTVRVRGEDAGRPDLLMGLELGTAVGKSTMFSESTSSSIIVSGLLIFSGDDDGADMGRTPFLPL